MLVSKFHSIATKILLVVVLGVTGACFPIAPTSRVQVPVIMVPTSTTMVWEETDYAKHVASKPIEECPAYGSCDIPEHIYIAHLPTLRELVQHYFEPEDVPLMLRIAFCESSAKPDDKWSEAINPKSGATGWFQHLPKWWEERSYKAAFSGWLAVEPRANVGVAAWLYYKQPHPKWGNASHWYPSRSCWED